MYCDSTIRISYLPDSIEFNNIVDKINGIFGQQDTSSWASITTEQTNTVFNDSIVSVILRHGLPYLDYLDPLIVSRKFFITKKEIYDKVYLPVPSSTTCRFDLPKNCNIGAEAYLINVFGQPGDEDLSRYRCIYFSCLNHSSVEEWAGTTLPTGKYITHYAATFDNITNERLRVKTYCYDEKTPYSEWNRYDQRIKEYNGSK